MLSARSRDGVICVRLHRMFAAADDRLLEEVAAFLKNRHVAMPRFRQFIRNHRDLFPAKRPNRVFLTTSGRFHDLRTLFDDINERYFNGAVKAAITWGAGCSRRVVRKRTLGSYSERSNLIRINPVLDRRTVPRYYVAFVVYHEMLHAALGISRTGGRRQMHTAEFREREKLFEHYAKALSLERA